MPKRMQTNSRVNLILSKKIPPPLYNHISDYDLKCEDSRNDCVLHVKKRVADFLNQKGFSDEFVADVTGINKLVEEI